uniref:Major sperm protein n=1 Tax=Acrobeloides nanus TaxID=290746 RepID=A0A914D1V3_9BILA
MAQSENKKLQLEPADKVTFSGLELDKYPDTVTLKLKNTTSERLAYKVKCTSNAHFRIRPSVCLVEAGATADVQLTFSLPANETTVPENGRHYFAVYHIKAPKADEKPRDTWAKHKGDADGEKLLQVHFKKEAVAETKPAEEKKKAPKKEESKKDDATDKPDEKDSKKSDKGADGKKDEDSDKEESEDEDSGDDDSMKVTTPTDGSDDSE